MLLSVTLLGSPDRELLLALRDRGYRVTEASLADVAGLIRPGAKGPDAFVIDIRATVAAARTGRR